MNTIGVICSIIAALGVLYSIIKENIEKRQADPILILHCMSGGVQGGRIENRGKSVAKNIKISFTNNTEAKFCVNEKQLYDAIIYPGQSYALTWTVSRKISQLEYDIEWKDNLTAKVHKKHGAVQVL